MTGTKISGVKIISKKLAEKRAKKIAKQGDPKSPEDKTIPIDQVITLDHLTKPDKN